MPLGDHSGLKSAAIWAWHKVTRAVKAFSRFIGTCHRLRCTHSTYTFNEAGFSGFIWFSNEVWVHWFSAPPSPRFIFPLSPTLSFLLLFHVFPCFMSCHLTPFSPTSLLLGFYLRKKEVATLTGRAPELCGWAACVQALSLCGWALSPGLVLLCPFSELCGWALWLGSVSRPCPPLVLLLAAP